MSMHPYRWKLVFLFVLAALLTMAFQSFPAPEPDPAPPPGPDRFSIITVKSTSYEWQLLTWKNKTLACTLEIDHEGMPFAKEVYRDCGETIYKTWITQPPCAISEYRSCPGYFAVLTSSQTQEEERSIQLAPASAWISLENCEYVYSTATHICETQPSLVITGQESLPNESILRIEGTWDGQPFDCADTDTCKFDIPETVPDGVPVEFWAYSSYGDSSPIFTAQVRAQLRDEGDPDQLYWYVDILSSQWRGNRVATCSDSWNVFPPVGGAPAWLSTPPLSKKLSSDIPYTYLAANLILHGAVDARSCPDSGLLPGNIVNQCGLEKSRDAVVEWQNQFDELILSTAKETGVPARLIKNLFARESQFWPGIFQDVGDAGLGQLTENGADATLFWNRSFYNQFCPLVMDAEVCGNGYMNLETEQQAVLCGALVSSVNATCETCPLGLDLAQAEFSVRVFAHTMIANCKQAGQVVYNYTGESAGEIATYEDLWKFTLVNYNAGGGCLAEGLSGAVNGGKEITWKNVAPYLIGACLGSVDYVNDISQ